MSFAKGVVLKNAEVIQSNTTKMFMESNDKGIR
jgi:hypothetical protein